MSASTPTVFCPSSLAEALEILHGEEGARPVAGGTDLLVYMKEGTKRPPALVDLTRIEALRQCEDRGERLRLGPLTTHTELTESESVRRHAPVLAEGAGWVGSVQIRNVATLGGNVANASPVADTLPPLFVLRATLGLASVRGERTLEIADFATGPGVTRLAPDELIVFIEVDKMGPDERGFFRRLAPRRRLSIAKLSVAFRARLDGKRVFDPVVALGALAPKVIYSDRSASYLEGKALSRRLAREAARRAGLDATPITDIRSTVEYRRAMVTQLVYQGLEALLAAS